MDPDRGPDAAARELLTDAFGRIHQLVGRVTEGADRSVLCFRADADANTVAWLIWHLTRVQDTHVAELAHEPAVWEAGGWVEQFDLALGPDDTGYGASSEEVGALDGVDALLLRGYHEAVHDLTSAYLASVDHDELSRVVDASWDPPVTASARLVSVTSDCLQHLGQASYVRGLAERAHRPR
ncbi:mycothiol transferase [Aquihabitans sp. McL0605]|uniref:mycothiol transferase n=1 Tax=Aquihabitans sp. McL0605 TaxID=3415671 RepID=UPI003CE6FF1E